MKNLTDRFVDSVKPDKGKRVEYPDSKIEGLALRVSIAGTKSWSLRYRRKSDGKRRRITIAAYPSISLADARDEAMKIMGEVVRRKDPAKDRRRSGPGKPRTFGELADRYLANHASSKRSGFKDRQILEKDVLPQLEGEPLDEIERAEITAILDAIVARGAPIQANRTFEIIRKIFNWAIEKGFMNSSPVFRMKPPAKKRSRDRTLTPEEIRSFWRRLIAKAHMGWETRTILKLCLITGQRVDEVAGAQQSELDLAKAEWRLPGERVKNGSAHVIPLSPLAVLLFRKALWRAAGNSFVFPSPYTDTYVTGGAVARAMRRSRKVFGFAREATPHDLRRTLASGLGELGVPRLVQDKVLNHVSADRSTISGIYDRHSYMREKREALEAWAEHLRSLIRP